MMRNKRFGGRMEGVGWGVQSSTYFTNSIFARSPLWGVLKILKVLSTNIE